MAPTIVLQDNQPYLAIGSPGGSRIIGYVAQAIVAHTQWGMNIQAAINQPHVLNRFGEIELEQGTSAEQFKPALESLGQRSGSKSSTLACTPFVLLHKVLRAADPRREGVAIGE